MVHVQLNGRRIVPAGAATQEGVNTHCWVVFSLRFCLLAYCRYKEDNEYVYLLQNGMDVRVSSLFRNTKKHVATQMSKQTTAFD